VSLLTLYLVLLKATALSFSGFGSVPVVREELVLSRQVLTDEQLNDAIAISQASPGPLGLYMVTVGYVVAGLAGAVVAALALASPAVLAIPIVVLVRRGSDTYLRGAYRAIVIASCVLMAVTGSRLAPQAVPSASLVVLAIAAFVTLAATRVPPIAVILLCALLANGLP
jgi:chromate transporter